MNKYYIKFGISKNNNAGSKAMKDIMRLLDSKGYKPVLSLPTDTNKLIKIIDIPILLLTLLFKVRNNGTIIYFVPSNHLRIKLLYLFKQIIGYKLICFINDIDSLRMQKSENFLYKEMRDIKCADIILAPNNNSVDILRNEYNFSNHLIPIGVWDYLSEHRVNLQKEISSRPNYNESIAFAGNLEKAPFIKELYLLNLHFKIWGKQIDNPYYENIDFMGEKNPDELINDISKCAWGLVWDGISIDSCIGSFGSYLRFNNSHKCGLYLAAEIPLIVWENGGMADLVNKYMIGICVSSLQEATNKINHMDIDTYDMYRKNAQLIGKDIRNGNFFLNALEKAMNIKC